MQTLTDRLFKVYTCFFYNVDYIAELASVRHQNVPEAFSVYFILCNILKGIWRVLLVLPRRKEVLNQFQFFEVKKEG